VITSRATRVLGLAMICLIGTACGSAVRSTDTATPDATGPAGGHSAAATAARTPSSQRSSAHQPPVVVIFMENEESSSIVGNMAGAPYISKTLIPSGTLFTNYYAVSHPSLPNYLALTVGNTCGKDGTDTVTPLCAKPSIWTQMSAAGITAREWAENESANCSYTSDGTGQYAQRHDSYAMVADAEALPACGDLTTGTGSSSPGLAPLDAALASASPPAYSFVTPNVCDDMHSCPIRSGDSWLSANVPGLLRAGADVIVTFDEGTSNTNGGGQVMTVEAGPGVAAGAKDGTLYTHYGLLAGIEKHFGLPLLANARTATPLPIGGQAG
jgi:phosphatidylinositol-3-phosphatase